MGWHVYVLLNDARIAYTGIAKDVAARLEQHNAGRGARFTRGRGPWRVIHIEGPMGHGDALRRESAIKGDAVFKRILKASCQGAAPGHDARIEADGGEMARELGPSCGRTAP